MKIGVIGLGLIVVLGWSAAASAQQAPRARTGFQMDIRTGYAIPLGDAFKDGKLSDITSGQVPIIVDIGGKAIPQLFLGGYLGLGFGGAGGKASDQCEALNATCASVSFNLGVEAQYHILPQNSVNPWIGYGLGFQSLAMGRKVNGDTVTGSFSGFEFARLMGGVDFRLNRVFGVGPFVDLSMAKYGSYKDDDDNSHDIPETALHEWLTLGVRFVFFP